MAITLNETRVKNDQQFSVMLDNLQANILKGHGRDFAHHLFFQFEKNMEEQAKQWIGQFANQGITTAKQQVEGTANFHKGLITDAGTIVTLSLSASGYNALGLQASSPMSSSAFSNGMANSAGLLKDDSSKYEEAFKSQIDMLIIVADDCPSTAKMKSADIIGQVSSFAALQLNQKGNVLKTKSGVGIEHFGYADGISQPLYFEDEILKQRTTVEWDDTTELHRVLVPDTATEVTDSFGSFLVFRKLEQNIKKFKDEEGDNAPTPGNLPMVKDVSGADNKELAGAMLVGRFENSTPTIKSSIEIQSNPPEHTNDFNYANDLSGAKCPFHSHIRLMNPRKGDTVAGDVSAQRITRRGIPFDDVNRIAENQITVITDEMLDSNQPVTGTGLLFMCYQSSIEFQFEILQAHWANEGQILAHSIGAQDSLIGQGTNPDKTLPLQWGQPGQSKPFAFKDFVTNRGGEYFFTPSVSFLRSLTTINSQS